MEPEDHIGKEWFLENCNRQNAESMLKHARRDGYYLVRKSENDPTSYALSFVSGHTVNLFIDRAYLIGKKRRH